MVSSVILLSPFWTESSIDCKIFRLFRFSFLWVKSLSLNMLGAGIQTDQPSPVQCLLTWKLIVSQLAFCQLHFSAWDEHYLPVSFCSEGHISNLSDATAPYPRQISPLFKCWTSEQSLSSPQWSLPWNSFFFSTLEFIRSHNVNALVDCCISVLQPTFASLLGQGELWIALIF